MSVKQTYANGQTKAEMIGDQLILYYRDGKVKAAGRFIDNLREGEWKFYRSNGQLKEVGNYKSSKKNGPWMRYDKSDRLEYHEEFVNDKIVR
jgi:antitoxin component YwqK of YwqJK toxin-antitoxin module